LPSKLESCVLLLDGSLQRRDLVLQSIRTSGGLLDLDVEGVALMTNLRDILLELLHPSQ
jgi:hypothetical protein